MRTKPFPFIDIAGIIGAGKSTLTKQLCDRLNAEGHPFEPYLEHVANNPYLDGFYKSVSDFYNMDEREKQENTFYYQSTLYKAQLEAFAIQIYFLNERYIDHKKIQYMLERDRGAIQDRSIFEDGIFVEMLSKDGLIRPIDKLNYEKNYRIKAMHFKDPDLIIFLDVTPEIAFERVKKRGRNEEKGLSIQYLRNLRENYLRWVDSISRRVEVLRVDWNEDHQNFQFMLDRIIDQCEEAKHAVFHASEATTSVS